MTRITRWFFIVLMGAFAVRVVALRAWSQTNSEAPKPDLAAEEKETCTKNLKAIYEAVAAYQRDNKDLPNWLSDLIPQYLADANLLVCPVCRRTGKTEEAALADPRIPSSYLFEFCPVPLGAVAPGKTRREWKRRQMGLAGSVVPIVRCRHHDSVLNLAFDGSIYESGPIWETLLTNRINPAELTPAKMFPKGRPTAASESDKPPVVRHFPPRDPKARKELLDLSAFYNAMLSESWHGGTGNSLAGLTAGVQKLGGVEFDVRGIVQLASKSPSASKFPKEVKGIKVGQKCQHVHFLHAAGFGNTADEGKPVGGYVVHFGANQMRLEIPIYYGKDVRNWHSILGEGTPPRELQVAWKGENDVSRQVNGSVRLFLTTWTNLVPSVEIERIDCLSSTNIPAPFLVAITVD